MKKILQSWKNSLKGKQKKRGYQHFDKILDLDKSRDFLIVKQVIKNIENHQFLPFIKFQKKEIRYRKNEQRVAMRSQKIRPIMYASHTDAFIYSYFAFLWSEKYEDYLKKNDIENSVIAYRKIPENSGNKNKCNIHHAKEIFEYIQNKGDCVAIIIDISNFFDSLKHRELKKQLCTILNQPKLSKAEYKIFKSLTTYRYILKNSKEYLELILKIQKRKRTDAETIYRLGKGSFQKNKSTIGIPQGSPLSGLMANIYLSEFDKKIKNYSQEVLYKRYSDDIILISDTKKADELFLVIKALLKEYSLSLNPAKVFFNTFLYESETGKILLEVKDGNGKSKNRKYLDYLGFEFDGKTISIRKKTIQKAYKKAKKKIKKYHLRQTIKNPKKKHQRKKSLNRNRYIEKSLQVMGQTESNIYSQKNKLDSFIKRVRRKYTS